MLKDEEEDGNLELEDRRVDGLRSVTLEDLDDLLDDRLANRHLVLKTQKNYFSRATALQSTIACFKKLGQSQSQNFTIRTQDGAGY